MNYNMTLNKRKKTWSIRGIGLSHVTEGKQERKEYEYILYIREIKARQEF